MSFSIVGLDEMSSLGRAKVYWGWVMSYTGMRKGMNRGLLERKKGKHGLLWSRAKDEIMLGWMG
jgi:hypothetical protein